jgi:RNA polymerase sigma-70 factor (ECF subfamily)
VERSSGGVASKTNEAEPASVTSEAELVGRCRAGEAEAWSELVDRFSDYVFSIAHEGFRLPLHDAEEVFQETFTRTYEHLDSLRDDRAVGPWIKQITRRLCIDRKHAGSREVLTEDEVELAEVDETLAELDNSLEIRTAVSSLPPQCQEILQRFFFEDQGYRTIGAELELPAGTIASRISRCLMRLRSSLQEDDSQTVVGHGELIYLAEDKILIELLACMRPAPEEWAEAARHKPTHKSSS